jgi:hypothetical protein
MQGTAQRITDRSQGTSGKCAAAREAVRVELSRVWKMKPGGSGKDITRT